MKAIQFDRFGGTAELHLADVEVPQPGPGQVRVQVRAAGVNALDGKVRSGAMSAVFPTSLPAIPGYEVAGVVDAVGDGVHEVTVGDHVVGWSDTGAYAQYALATTVAIKPTDLDWEHSVALPIAGATAERVLDLLEIADGETVLMHGAAGAVGTVAVQLATARGARVIATAGPTNQDYLTSLGASATVYGEGLVERVRALAPGGVDAVFDLAGKGALDHPAQRNRAHRHDRRFPREPARHHLRQRPHPTLVRTPGRACSRRRRGHARHDCHRLPAQPGRGCSGRQRRRPCPGKARAHRRLITHRHSHPNHQHRT